METQLEIEYKTLITKDMYQQLLTSYSDKICERCTHINYYIMHPVLEAHKYMLRIRHKDNTFELTLKQPQEIGNLETNSSITKQEALHLLENEDINNPLLTTLEDMSFSIKDADTSQYLITQRADIAFSHGVLSIDKNEYNGVVDYEIEFEVSNKDDGYHEFLDIIKPLSLSYQTNCPSKIQRLKATQ